MLRNAAMASFALRRLAATSTAAARHAILSTTMSPAVPRRPDLSAVLSSPRRFFFPALLDHARGYARGRKATASSDEDEEDSIPKGGMDSEDDDFGEEDFSEGDEVPKSEEEEMYDDYSD